MSNVLFIKNHWWSYIILMWYTMIKYPNVVMYTYKRKKGTTFNDDIIFLNEMVIDKHITMVVYDNIYYLHSLRSFFLSKRGFMRRDLIIVDTSDKNSFKEYKEILD